MCFLLAGVKSLFAAAPTFLYFLSLFSLQSPSSQLPFFFRNSPSSFSTISFLLFIAIFIAINQTVFTHPFIEDTIGGIVSRRVTGWPKSYSPMKKFITFLFQNIFLFFFQNI